MSYRKPPVRYLANLGDVNPIEYDGGYLVRRYFQDWRFNPDTGYLDRANHYWEHQIEMFQNDSDSGTTGTLYQVIVPKDVAQEHNWVNFEDVARSIGMHDQDGNEIDGEALRRLGRSEDVMERVFVIESIAGYHGWQELDHEPRRITHSELRRRWRTPLGKDLG